ncbi:MAG: alpha-glucan family phosphorylase [Phycisphaera sp.]|nr:MAG: alpha-glucan family phosphorylase [Phycisphaera sp.]
MSPTSYNQHLGIDPRVAYFTMEIALSDRLPTFSGGLGVLAGDTIRSATNLHVPVVAVSLLHRGGYFKQTLDKDGTQHDEPIKWQPEKQLQRLPTEISVKLDGRTVRVGAWKTTLKNVNDDYQTPVIFLDTDLPQNKVDHRKITNRLYGGDDELRLRQEAILGIGGVRMLQALSCSNLKIYHMNEGHASLLVPELTRHIARHTHRKPTDPTVLAEVKEKCVFTTHTPVPAGHDRFPMEMVHQILDPEIFALLHAEPEGAMHEAPMDANPTAAPQATQAVGQQASRRYGGTAVAEPPPPPEGTLNMTLTGFWGSGRINAVARRHAEVSRKMFGRDDIQSVTNGIHARTWVCGDMAKLFDKEIPAWRQDNSELRFALDFDPKSLLKAHLRAKVALIDRVNELTDAGFDVETFTIGFARRATAYKRLTLLLRTPKTLDAIAEKHGGMQIVLAGKAHPKDEPGQAMIVDTLRKAKRLKHARVVYLPGYNMDLCGLMTAGSDIWLNTPRPPLEASGTSGMKAAINGVPSLSTLDGWWIEGCVEGLTGWAIGKDDFAPTRKRKAPTTNTQDKQHAEDIYNKLENQILPAYEDRSQWARIMANTIALNGAHFTTQRMVREYVSGLYFV